MSQINGPPYDQGRSLSHSRPVSSSAEVRTLAAPSMIGARRDQLPDMSTVVELLSTIAHKVDMVDQKIGIVDQKVDGISASVSQEIQKLRGFERGQSSNRLLPLKDDDVSISTSANLSSGDFRRDDSAGVSVASSSKASAGPENRLRSKDSSQIAEAIKRSATEAQLQESSCRGMLDQFLNDPDSSRAAQLYMYVSTFTTLLAVLLTVFQATQPAIISGAGVAAWECTVEALWSVEFLLRLACSRNRLLFIRDALSVIDLLVIAPFFLRASVGFVISSSDADSSSTVAFLLFAVPMLRLLKVLRSFKKFNLLVGTALKVYVETMPVMLMLFWLVLIFTGLMYAAEPRDNMATYQQAMWFVIVTMTTVGYGDVSPSSTGGYVIGSVLISVSVFMMAMPIGIIGTSVAEVWKERHTILLRSWAKQRLSDWGYTAEQIPELFEAFDPNGDGELSFGEFRDMLQEMRIGIRDEKIFQLFQSFDADGSGTVDSKEFIQKLFPTEYIKMFEEPSLSQRCEDDQPVAPDEMSIGIIPASPTDSKCAWS